jgi:hypothetical protein
MTIKQLWCRAIILKAISQWYEVACPTNLVKRRKNQLKRQAVQEKLQSAILSDPQLIRRYGALFAEYYGQRTGPEVTSVGLSGSYADALRKSRGE